MALGPRLVPVVLLAACGRIGFQSELPPEESCDWSREFYLQSPSPLAGVSTGGNDRAPFVTADGAILYFATDEAGEGDFYSVDIERDIPLAAPERFDELSSASADTALSFATDHLEAYFASERGGSGTEIYRARRPAQPAPFLGEALVAALSSAEGSWSPHIAESDRALYFARGEAGTRDLYVAYRASIDDETFGPPARLAELSSDGDDLSPALTADGLTIVFASDREGSMNLYYATRASVDESFGEPVSLDAINSPGIDTDPFITRDGCFLYFASDRDGERLDLFVARAFR